MQLTTGGPHLGYCSNVHPGETLADVLEVLRGPVTAVKDALGARRLGVGLRLAHEASAELGAAGKLAELQATLADHGLYVFTLNGFPYGKFHRTSVKERVYLPDWRSRERLDYTNRLARILAELLPAGSCGSISTVPLGFRGSLDETGETLATEHLCEHLVTLFHLREERGIEIALALEPEPHCHLETISEAADYIERRFWSPSGVERLAQRTGLDRSEAEAFLHRHLGVCLDACHLAVEFEAPALALARLERSAIRVSKLQVSAGLSSRFTGDGQADQDTISALRRFVDPVYLHQVVVTGPRGRIAFLDLPDALDAYADGHLEGPCEWRIHFHVPVFLDACPPLGTTRRELEALLAIQRSRPFCDHIEVETYTWEVLPATLRPESLVTGLRDEVAWTAKQLSDPEAPNRSET